MAAAAAVFGVATTLYSSFQQSQAQQSQADAQQVQGAYGYRVGMQNAANADASAQSAIANGDLEAERLQTQARGTIGSQRASFAGQGVDVASGSASSVQTDTIKQSGIDANTLRSNAWKQALGISNQAANDREAAQFSLASGTNAAGATRTLAGSTLASGGMKAVGGYLDYYSRNNSTRSPGYSSGGGQ